MSFPRKPVSLTAQPKAAGASQTRKMPVAPPAYRPQPVPKVLQRKMAIAQSSQAAQPRRQPVAPPVYRPEVKKIVQPKMAATQTHKPPKAPSVYRPEQRKVLQPKLISQPQLTSQPRQPPTPPPVYRPGSSTIQRKIIEKTVYGKKIYYSDQDPKTSFNTREEAEIHELTLGLPRVDEGTRGPTLYNYTHTKSHCQISSVGANQGPHTLGHAAISKALTHSSSGQDIRVTFSEQVLSPDDWYQMVINEKGKAAFDGKGIVSKGLIRAHADYTALYKATTLLIKMGEEDKARYNIGLLMQMSPYAVYCWKSGTKASKKSLKYKGEGDDIMDSSNIDSGGKWKDPEGYKNYIEDRQLMMDDDYDDEDEDEGLHYERVKHNGPALWFSHDEIPADGHCLFNTLLALGIGAGNSVQQLRQLAANNGGQANIANNQGPVIWGNHQDITALANHFGIRIGVAVLSIWDNSVLQYNVYGGGGPVHLIAQIHGGHFTPLYKN